MKPSLLLKTLRLLLFATVSLGICFAMTHFTVSREGMMPYWMQSANTYVLQLFGVEEPIGVEDVMDMSLLTTLIVYWITVSLIMFVVFRLIRRTRRYKGAFLALIVCTYAASHLLALWINDLVIKPVQFKRDPDNFQFPYLFCVIVLSWLTVIAASFAMHPIIKKNCPRSRRSA
jgi:hypothetical protein